MARMLETAKKSALRWFRVEPKGGGAGSSPRRGGLRRARFNEISPENSPTHSTHEDAHFSCRLVHSAGVVLAVGLAGARCLSHRVADFFAATLSRDHRGGSLCLSESASVFARQDPGRPQVPRLNQGPQPAGTSWRILAMLHTSWVQLAGQSLSFTLSWS
jgi:hypothetical protein